MVISGTAQSSSMEDTVKPITTTNYHSLAAGALNTLIDSGSETVKLKFKQCHEWGRAVQLLLSITCQTVNHFRQ